MADDVAAVKAAVAADKDRVLEAALRVIEGDPHVWGTRPCASCAAVSDLAGRPFGCAAKAAAHHAATAPVAKPNPAAHNHGNGYRGRCCVEAEVQAARAAGVAGG